MEKYKSSPYRWIILLCMIPVLAMTDVYWLTFAPITSTAEKFYGVSALHIAFLSMSYMIIYIIMAFPASWLVDTKGFRAAIGTGALLTAVFGMLRGIFASNFTIVTVAQLGVAAGQPFLVNSITKTAARWFPINERATASGIATMAGYIGMVVALVFTPSLTGKYGIEQTLMIYGYAAIICALIFILFSRERPKTPPGPSEELVSELNVKAIKGILHNKDYLYLMICLFVVMGIFNAVMTWIEDIVRPRGIISDQAGLIGGIMVVVGLIGAVVLPTMSDKLRKRRSFLIWPIFIAIPGFMGLTFLSNYYLLLICSAIMGFCVLGVGPIAFQYGAEMAYPVPEGTSYGILMTMGQISGIIFIFAMDSLRSSASGNMTIPLVILILLMFAVLLLSRKFKESYLIANTGETRLSVTGDAAKAAEVVCSSGKRLSKSGFASDTRGAISLRIDDNTMAITPNSRQYEQLTPGDIVMVNINRLSYEGNTEPSSEMCLHAEIYKNRKEICAVIHISSPDTNTAAASNTEIPPILDDMAQIIGPSIKVADYAIPDTRKQVEGAVKALAGRNGVLLAGHGAVCIGRDMDEAAVACEILEKACRAYIESGFIGGGVPISGLEARFMHIYYVKKYSKRKKLEKVDTSKEIAAAREAVCESGKRLLRSGLVSGTWGNISCRINDEYMAITPSGREYEVLTPDDIVVVNINDLSYAGNVKPSSEKNLHAEIYKNRREICSIIHTHSPNASIVAASRKEVPLMHEEMLQFIGPSIRIADYALPSTRKLTKAAMKALDGRNAALLANHGAICTGRNMEDAFAACEILERSCRAFIDSKHSVKAGNRGV